MKKELVLHNDVREIPQLATLVDSVAEALSLAPGPAMSLNLALEEAVTNVMMYAYPAGSRGRVDVCAEVEGREARFTIVDAGIPFDPTAAPEADVSLGVADRPIGGLGIFLVRRIMDSVAYRREDGRNVLTLLKSF